MMPFSWEIGALAIDAACVYLFYKLYKDGSKASDMVKNAADYDIGPELKEALLSSSDHTIPYAAVEGSVHAVGDSIKSHFGEDFGVIQKLETIEHKTKRTQGFWSDYLRMVKDSTNTTVFSIKSQAASDESVYVTEPLNADFLMDDLKVTYDKFEPVQSSLMERTVDRIFGDVTKGFQETERMLTVGIPILGIGKLTWNGKKMKIEPPNEGQKYILTSLSKGEVIKKLQSKAKIFKILTVITGLIGTGILAYWLYKKYVAWSHEHELRQVVARVQEMRHAEHETTADSNSNANENDADRNCVICLINRREVVLLDCGHICICADCADVLPFPKKCPICRGSVSRIVSTYIS